MRKLLIAVIVLTACSDGTGPVATTMTALVNGATFTGTPAPDGHIGLLDTADMSLSVIGIHVISVGMVYETIGLSLRNYHGTGAYQTCGFPSSAYGTYFKQNEQDTALGPFFVTDSACSGEVDVQSYDPLTLSIAGTFHFNGVDATSDTVHVTDGKFSGKVAIATLIIDPPSPPAIQRR